jgi:hypothetical protein
MNKLNLVAGMFVITLLVGCAGNREAVLKATAQTRQDVYQVTLQPKVLSGKALLKIEFSIKSFKARLVNTYFKYTDFTTIINIDGQSMELTDEPVLEDLLGNPEINPEVGRGWRYIFKSNLLLSPGNHRITIAMPQLDVVVERDLTLIEGESLLNIVPIYKTSSYQKSKYPKFENGLYKLVLNLNSQVL